METYPSTPSFTAKPWTCRPSSSFPSPPHAGIALQTDIRSGWTSPSLSIRRNTPITSAGQSPSCASPQINAFHETRSLAGISSNTLLASPRDPPREYAVTSALPTNTSAASPDRQASACSCRTRKPSPLPAASESATVHVTASGRTAPERSIHDAKSSASAGSGNAERMVL
uniref:Uncharacterized protein n=1 Tax=Oryza glumipatula TaxID=40148 RepID=A0A0E0AP29_9ORYZ